MRILSFYVTTLLPKVGTNEHEQEGFEAAFAAQLRVCIYVCEP